MPWRRPTPWIAAHVRARSDRIPQQALRRSQIRSSASLGLTSRSGVAPLNLLADIAGPMTRTLEDVVIVLQVIAGPDQDDPVTVPGTPIARDFSPSGRPANFPNFVASLKKDGLKGRRIGVLRQAYESATTDPEIVKVFMAAVEGRLHLTATKVVDSSRYWSY